MKCGLLLFLISLSSLSLFGTPFQKFDSSSPEIASQNHFQSLKNHPVFKLVQGRWQGPELNVYVESGESKIIPRDFRIGPNADGTRLVFESLIPNDDYIGYFSYYDEDCLQYNEYGFVQHLCLGASGNVAWSGPCSAGSYRTKMRLEVVDGKEALTKAGDHWDHSGKLHRKNTANFIRIHNY